MRLDLSHIQGKVYDLLYSNRSLRIPPAERKRRVSQLSTMLSQWYERIPTAFRIEHVSATVGDTELVQMVKLHHAYLHALVHVHGVYSHQAEWIGLLGSLSRAAIEQFAVTMQGPSSTCGNEQQSPPEGKGWEECVEVARGCMKLFQDTTPTECLIWQCSCAHFSGLIILLANMILSPTHPYVSLDQQISNRAVRLFESMLQFVTTSAFHTLHQLIQDLHTSANTAVDQARLNATQNDDDVENVFAANMEGGQFEEHDLGFPSFIGEEGMTGEFQMDGPMWDSFSVGMEGQHGFGVNAFHAA